MIDLMIRDGMSFALPLFIMAIGGIYCERSGIVNLCLEGFQGVGAFTGALAALLVTDYFVSGSQLPFYIAVFFAMIGGGVFSLIHALLCLKFKAKQSVSGVVVNILASSLTLFLTKFLNTNLFGRASDKFALNVVKRITIPGLSEIPVLGAFFTEIYPYNFIITAVAVLAWYVLYRTKFGMDLRACGEMPQAVDAAGVSVVRVQLIAIVVSGALSGIAGICFAYSVSASFSSAIFMGYGYLSIASLIFGNWKILPTLVSCLIFGFARSGGYVIVR
ncbi:MAG: ABC transporter permease, partial [Eubacteriales bacterium]